MSHADVGGVLFWTSVLTLFQKKVRNLNLNIHNLTCWLTLTNPQFHGRVFPEYFPSISNTRGDRPREILVKYFHASDHSHGSISRVFREDSSRGQFAGTRYQFTTVYTSTCAREIPAHGTVGTAHTSISRVSSILRGRFASIWNTREILVKYPPMELGGKPAPLQVTLGDT